MMKNVKHFVKKKENVTRDELVFVSNASICFFIIIGAMLLLPKPQDIKEFTNLINVTGVMMLVLAISFIFFLQYNRNVYYEEED